MRKLFVLVVGPHLGKRSNAVTKLPVRNRASASVATAPPTASTPSNPSLVVSLWCSIDDQQSGS